MHVTEAAKRIFERLKEEGYVGCFHPNVSIHEPTLSCAVPVNLAKISFAPNKISPGKRKQK